MATECGEETEGADEMSEGEVDRVVQLNEDEV